MKYQVLIEKHCLTEAFVEANTEEKVYNIALANLKNGVYENEPARHTQTYMCCGDEGDWVHVYETEIGYLR